MITKRFNLNPVRKSEFRSAEWAAHNATVAAKRKLLKGQKPVIGALYRPRLQVEPAISTPSRRERMKFKHFVQDVLMLIGAVTVLGGMLFIGAAVGF